MAQPRHLATAIIAVLLAAAEGAAGGLVEPLAAANATANIQAGSAGGAAVVNPPAAAPAPLLSLPSKGGDDPGAVPAALQNHTGDLYFPIFHVRPGDGWHPNDPNAPFFFNGVFHLFSQCRKMAAAFPIPPGGWCHYGSKDLVKWRRLGYALRPDRWYDEISLDTGSATVVDGVPTMLIPSVGKVTDGSVNFTCPHFRAASLRGACRVRMTEAIPADLTDPWLRVWVKPDSNPLIDAPPSDIEPYWHDFSSAWQEGGRWWAFAGAGWLDRRQAPCPSCRAGAPVPLCSAPNGSFHERGAWSCQPGDELWVATNATAGEPTDVFAHDSWSAAAFSCPEFYGLPTMPASHRIFEGLLDDGKDHYWCGTYDHLRRRFDPTGYTALKYNWVSPVARRNNIRCCSTYILLVLECRGCLPPTSLTLKRAP